MVAGRAGCARFVELIWNLAMSRDHVSASLGSGQVLTCDAYLALWEGRVSRLAEVLVGDVTTLVCIKEIPLIACYTECE